jgi:glutathione S-transferase kappa 1
VKDNYPSSMLEAAAQECSKALYNSNSDISKPDEMRACLSRCDGLDVEKTMEAAGSPPVKAKLLDTTEKALVSGAYGCPWFEVTNGQGVKEPFFGSDR